MARLIIVLSNDWLRRVRRGLKPALLAAALLFSGCTSVTIDHYSNGQVAVDEDDAVVVLGRRVASNYDTEVDLVSCVGDSLEAGRSGLKVIPEQEFIDSLYPWFEPRIAPMRVAALHRLIKNEKIAEAMDQYHISHIIWIDGKTETTDSSGSIGCSIGAGGAGCFGFGTWDQESEYEASIWDYRHQELLGKVSTDATGTSYMPAVIIPIPLIARVQANACRGMAEQLRAFFTPAQASR